MSHTLGSVSKLLEWSYYSVSVLFAEAATIGTTLHCWCRLCPYRHDNQQHQHTFSCSTSSTCCNCSAGHASPVTPLLTRCDCYRWPRFAPPAPPLLAPPPPPPPPPPLAVPGAGFLGLVPEAACIVAKALSVVPRSCASPPYGTNRDVLLGCQASKEWASKCGRSPGAGWIDPLLVVVGASLQCVAHLPS